MLLMEDDYFRCTAMYIFRQKRKANAVRAKLIAQVVSAHIIVTP